MFMMYFVYTNPGIFHGDIKPDTKVSKSVMCMHEFCRIVLEIDLFYLSNGLPNMSILSYYIKWNTEGVTSPIFYLCKSFYKILIFTGHRYFVKRLKVK